MNDFSKEMEIECLNGVIKHFYYEFHDHEIMT